MGAVKTRLHKARATLRATLWTLWMEEETNMATVTAAKPEYIDVRILDVRGTHDVPDQPSRATVLLEEVDGARVLAIRVGHFEGDSIAVLLERVEMVRPLTFSFAASVLQAAGGTLREVRVNRLDAAGGIFYGEAVVDGPAGIRVVDCRPSDALSLALTTNAPIRVASTVMDVAAEPRAQFADVSEGTLTAVDSARRIREMMARAHEAQKKVHEAS